MPKSKLYVKLDWLSWNNDKGQTHREDGSAIEHLDGSKSWLLNGLLHREDGPAHENANGTKYWYLNGVWYTEKVYNDIIKTLR